MQMTRVLTAGGQADGAGLWLIADAVGEAPARVFRQELYLQFVLDGYADGILISEAQTRLRGRFLPYDYDARQVDKPALMAQLRNVDNAVLVQLDAPRQLRAVHLSSAIAPGASSKVTVHRVDGTQVTEEATAEIGVTSAFATAATALHNSPLRPLLAQRAAPSDTTSVSSGLSTQVARAFTVANLGTDFTDARFGLRLRNSATPLTVNHLTGLPVRSYPSAPRLGLGALVPPAPPTFFLRLAGEIGKDGDSNTGQVAADQLLADALQAYVDAFFTKVFVDAQPELPVLPHELQVTLVLESDAPCYLQLDEFVVVYQLLRRNFPDYAEKQVLRFAGTSVETQRVSLRLPATATVTQATLTVAPTLAATTVAAQTAAAPLPLDPLTQASGVHLGLNRWAAQPLTPAHAFMAQGVLLGLLALTPDTQLELVVAADEQGQPAGKQIASATVTLAQSKTRFWQTLRFTEPVPLFAQPYWLLLRSARGAALWLTQPGASAVQMMAPENQRWQPLAAIPHTAGLVQWLTPAMNTKQAPALSVQIDDNPVLTPPVITDDDRQLYDLTAALNGALANKDGTELVELPLTITTATAGVLTLYPPVIAYTR